MTTTVRTAARAALTAALIAAGALTTPTAAIAQPLARQQAVNPTATPADELLTAFSVGWFFTPTHDYQLGGVNTRFGAGGADRAVAFELFTGSPFDAAPVRTGSFHSSAARLALGGGVFDEGLLRLSSSRRYFIGFRNVEGLGVNFTDALGAGRLGALRLGLAGGPAYEFADEADDLFGRDERAQFKPVLEFVGAPAAAPGGPPNVVPEPGTVALVGAGLAGLGLAARRRNA